MSKGLKQETRIRLPTESRSEHVAHLAVTKNSTQRRRVRFQEDTDDDNVSVISEINSPSTMTAEEMYDVWWQRDEVRRMKTNAKSIAREILDAHACSSNYCSYVHVLQRVHDKIVKSTVPGDGEIPLFRMWIAVGHSRRGLEYWSIPGLASQQEAHRRKVVTDVIRAQRELNKTSSDIVEKAEFLRATSERLSAPVKRFASALGEADAIAARLEMLESGYSFGESAVSSSFGSQSVTYIQKWRQFGRLRLRSGSEAA